MASGRPCTGPPCRRGAGGHLAGRSPGSIRGAGGPGRRGPPARTAEPRRTPACPGRAAPRPPPRSRRPEPGRVAHHRPRPRAVSGARRGGADRIEPLARAGDDARRGGRPFRPLRRGAHRARRGRGPRAPTGACGQLPAVRDGCSFSGRSAHVGPGSTPGARRRCRAAEPQPAPLASGAVVALDRAPPGDPRGGSVEVDAPGGSRGLRGGSRGARSRGPACWRPDRRGGSVAGPGGDAVDPPRAHG